MGWPMMIKYLELLDIDGLKNENIWQIKALDEIYDRVIDPEQYQNTAYLERIRLSDKPGLEHLMTRLFLLPN